MPYHVQCLGCHTSAYVDCACPAELAGLPVHMTGCPVLDLDAQLVCPPESDCCKEDHHHGQAANACPGGHDECPAPAACKLHASVKRHHLAVAAADPDLPTGVLPDHVPEECPGGHCDVRLDDCTVCRPLVITAMPGSAQLQPAGG